MRVASQCAYRMAVLPCALKAAPDGSLCPCAVSLHLWVLFSEVTKCQQRRYFLDEPRFSQRHRRTDFDDVEPVPVARLSSRSDVHWRRPSMFLSFLF